MLLTSVNAGSTSWINVNLVDQYGAPAAPIAFKYQIDDILSGTNIVPEQTLATPGAAFQITVTAAQNLILNAANAQEYRRLTTTAVYGDGTDRITATYDWVVNALPFVPQA